MIAKAIDPSTDLNLASLEPYDRLAVFIDVAAVAGLEADTTAPQLFQAVAKALVATMGISVNRHYFESTGVEPIACHRRLWPPQPRPVSRR